MAREHTHSELLLMHLVDANFIENDGAKQSDKQRHSNNNDNNNNMVECHNEPASQPAKHTHTRALARTHRVSMISGGESEKQNIERGNVGDCIQ